jgi:hypothetical protein
VQFYKEGDLGRSVFSNIPIVTGIFTGPKGTCKFIIRQLSYEYLNKRFANVRVLRL